MKKKVIFRSLDIWRQCKVRRNQDIYHISIYYKFLHIYNIFHNNYDRK